MCSLKRPSFYHRTPHNVTWNHYKHSSLCLISISWGRTVHLAPWMHCVIMCHQRWHFYQLERSFASRHCLTWLHQSTRIATYGSSLHFQAPLKVFPHFSPPHVILIAACSFSGLLIFNFIKHDDDYVFDDHQLNIRSLMTGPIIRNACPLWWVFIWDVRSMALLTEYGTLQRSKVTYWSRNWTMYWETYFKARPAMLWVKPWSSSWFLMSGGNTHRELPITEMYIKVEYWKNITDTWCKAH